jgi:hypothetical protein
MATLKDTAQHFGVSIQAMSDYINKHLQDINTDGEHATIHRGKWFIDDVAIARLEQLRGFNDGAGLPLTQSPATVDDFRSVISKLQAEVETLKQRVEKLERTLEKEKTKEKGSWLNRMFK